MNKIITVLLSVILCMSLTACGGISESMRDEENDYLENSSQDTSQKEELLLNQDSILFVDRQGTNDIYSSLSILNNGDSYAVEMFLYRVGYFSGTAKETQGMLCYTDDHMGVTGLIRFDQGQASFEVRESVLDSVSAGVIWVFPEIEDGLNT